MRRLVASGSSKWEKATQGTERLSLPLYTGNHGLGLALGTYLCYSVCSLYILCTSLEPCSTHRALTTVVLYLLTKRHSEPPTLSDLWLSIYCFYFKLVHVPCFQLSVHVQFPPITRYYSLPSICFLENL